MKLNKRSFLFLCPVLILCACAQKYYELPKEMPPKLKEEYTAMCDKGQKLYFMNCSKCHDQKVEGKTVLPDFQPEHFKAYSLRMQHARRATFLPDSLVSEEELGFIMTFLTYKKRQPL
jgi:hypothetical protein